MVFNLSDVSDDIVAVTAKKLQPLLKNAVVTAFVIVIILVIVVIFTYEKENGVFKMAFWTLISTMIVLFVHDTVITNIERETYSANIIAESTYTPPDVLLDKHTVVGQKEAPKIQLPNLSIHTKPSDPNFHNITLQRTSQ